MNTRVPVSSEAGNVHTQRCWLLQRVLSALLLVAALGAPAAWGCRCKEPVSTAKAYRAARLVVLAEVLSVEGVGDSSAGARARLRVTEAWTQAWKADTQTELVVATRTTCAFNFEAGKSYLLYLARDSGRGEWTTRICRGNLPVAKADAAVTWLRGNAKKATVKAAIDPVVRP